MDREKVEKGLRICTSTEPCNGCPYLNERNCSLSMVADALELLNEQEAVVPKYNARTNWFECGNCHYSMTSGMHCCSVLIPATKVRYCANCGFPVNWEGR